MCMEAQKYLLTVRWQGRHGGKAEPQKHQEAGHICILSQEVGLD